MTEPPFQQKHPAWTCFRLAALASAALFVFLMPGAARAESVEIRGRSDVRVSVVTNGVSFTVRGTLIDDRGTGLGGHELVVDVSGRADAVAWRRHVTTEDDGSFRLAGSVAEDGTYVLRTVWDGDRWIDGDVETNTLELSRRPSTWRAVSPLLVPTRGEKTNAEGGAVVVLAGVEGSSSDVSLTGSCLEGGVFERSGSPTRRAGETDPNEAADPYADSNGYEGAVVLLWTDAEFVEPCQVEASMEESQVHQASSESITVVPVSGPLELTLDPASGPWSRVQVYNGRLSPVQSSPLNPPATFHLEASHDDGAGVRAPSTWDLASGAFVFHDVSTRGVDEAGYVVSHYDALGRPLWRSEEVRVSGGSRGESLRHKLVLAMLIIAGLALLTVIGFIVRKYVVRPETSHRRPRRTGKIESPPSVNQASRVPRDAAQLRDARSGWGIRDAWIRRHASSHVWTGSAREPGFVALPAAARGMNLVAGAPGYFESTFLYEGDEVEVPLRPAREFVHERVASMFSACGAGQFDKEDDWGTAAPRQVIFGTIRKRYPLWTDSLNLEETTRPVEAVQLWSDSEVSGSRTSIPNLLALAALLLETAMLAPSTPEVVPEFLEAIDESIARQGL